MVVSGAWSMRGETQGPWDRLEPGERLTLHMLDWGQLVGRCRLGRLAPCHWDFSCVHEPTNSCPSRS